MKKTKEQLIKENAELEAANKEFRDMDETIRRNFAREFKWFKKADYCYSQETEYRTPPWSEIYVELGRLLAAINFYDFEGNISELECAVEEIRKSLAPKEQV